MNIPWSDFITVNDEWIAEHLCAFEPIEEQKLRLRVYTLQYKGGNYDTADLIAFVKDSVKGYVLTPNEISLLEKNKVDPFEEALQYFGKVDPSTDGKYGELILYLLVESILKIPMVVFKIPLNSKDQVKGSDGIFLGEYDGKPAILIGEAKTWGELDSALGNAFSSLSRFHIEQGNETLKYEYLVARKGIRVNLSQEQLDYLYSCLILGSEENKTRSIVHPVLIIYNDDRIKTVTADEKTKAEAELKLLIESNLKDHFSTIRNLCESNKEVASVQLDFFFLPVKSVIDFRKALYQAMHGANPPTRKKRGRKAKTPTTTPN